MALGNRIPQAVPFFIRERRSSVPGERFCAVGAICGHQLTSCFIVRPRRVAGASRV